MIIIVCPGQGSQKPGFLAPWLADQQLVYELEQFSVIAGLDLEALGTVGTAEEIQNTAIAQALTFAASIVSYRALCRAVSEPMQLDGVAGHSLGEVTAAAISGIITENDGMHFAATRGRKMAEAANQSATGMSAVLGGDQNSLSAKVAEFGLVTANLNGGGQTVVAGSMTALDQFHMHPPTGARVIRLQVSGAFHTPYMASAQAAMSSFAAELQPKQPHMPLWSNSAGQLVTDGREFINLLLRQITSPVRWDLCMQSFQSAGVTGIIELEPAGALTGLVKRALPDVSTVAVKTPDDLTTAVNLIMQDR